MKKSIENYPDVLNVSDIQEILSIGKQQAYNLVHSKEFPVVKVGRTIKIYKPVFIKWLKGNFNNAAC